MIDRVPQQPNRRLITPEGGGTPFYATVERADNPVVGAEGTPLNKVNILSDETANMLGLVGEANRVPDKAFRASWGLAEGYLGELKQVYNELTDPWKLCDGSFMSIFDYPALIRKVAERGVASFSGTGILGNVTGTCVLFTWNPAGAPNRGGWWRLSGTALGHWSSSIGADGVVSGGSSESATVAITAAEFNNMRQLGGEVGQRWFIALTGGTLRTTTGAGATITTVTPSPAMGTLTSMSCNDTYAYFLAAATSTIYRNQKSTITTAANFAAWKTLPDTTYNGWLAVSNNENYIVRTNTTNGISYTRNGGTTWLTATTTGNITQAKFVTDTMAIVLSASGRVTFLDFSGTTVAVNTITIADAGSLSCAAYSTVSGYYYIGDGTNNLIYVVSAAREHITTMRTSITWGPAFIYFASEGRILTGSYNATSNGSGGEWVRSPVRDTAAIPNIPRAAPYFDTYIKTR